MSTPEAMPASTTPAVESNEAGEGSGLLAKGKRKLLALGKKADRQAQDKTAATGAARSPTSAPTLLPSPPLTTSPPPDRRSPRGSPRINPAGISASPNRRIRSTSPGLHSPASSQIFERNVQEPEPSPAIPAHIKTEDHIPAALDASSLAITDDHLNPDEVEIVMHAAHQPASAAVAGSMAESVHSPSLIHEEASLFSHPDASESASNANYGSVDTTDPRRLSFISFADVVQAEHAETDRDAAQFISLSATANRSPSPVRSPVSSHGFGASPPRSGATSEKGLGSPTAPGTHSPPLGGGGELQIETMRQALRRTGSGDLSGARSQPLSAISLEETAADRPPFR
ncbi:hypothetical protein DPSP01_007430 [Paraphaeosphaeria sporulosa]|uniref:Uncharacterized protein n=1 Tax=Paraphaeosphaeria sporulosa TaxID=1460663 RepID=A0A177CYB9_9PLEO|nr:uncharacterized protein CC84DRAFT_1107402 [Paraphaeosphaeria sporulosa]OAG11699.1 hypothetical protein CC84DRAFT_1107402 [Paraphaeosphaeria sporulosa]